MVESREEIFWKENQQDLVIDSVMGRRKGEAEIKSEPQIGWDDGGVH